MANIQTTDRLILVKESVNELYKKIDTIMDTPFFLIEVTEDTSFHELFSKKVYQGERKILININNIVEILP